MPAVRLTISGRVQGLGVRPAIYRLATALQLGGSVRNTPLGVEMELEGDAGAIGRFKDQLDQALPAAAVVERRSEQPIAEGGRRTFLIAREPAAGPLTVRVPLDLAVCPECLADVAAEEPRRGGYPFTSCTLCGPRYSIVRSMPYERADTSMQPFPLCAACAAEYAAPGDRRFHSQTNACTACGPRLRYHDPRGGEQTVGGDALRSVLAALGDQKIAAVQGLGGYQLLVDATHREAVARLRARKGRPAKPLAVMVGSLAEAERLAVLNDDERRALRDPSNPIVLVRARADARSAGGERPADNIYPGLRHIGLMLPTTPLHALLLQGVGRPLVCTSGNREGEPLEYLPAAARRRLEGIADVWLHHDRVIERPIDDSLVRIIAGRPVTLRLARGLAPLPLDLPGMPPALAVGGFLKSAAAWCNGAQAVLGPHVGDHRTLAARQRFTEQLAAWRSLYQFEPRLLVHDAHPDYYSTRWAIEQSGDRLAVQHHHAHVAAGMLEHGWLDRPVLGVAWDGTGYGSDGAVWGGEFLEVRGNRFRRVGHLRPVGLPGGEAAIHQPWRVALAMLADVVEWSEAVRWLAGFVDPRSAGNLAGVLRNPRLSPTTTSAGRLFDAVASLLLEIHLADFDGQPAMYLEAVADRDAPGSYRMPIAEGTPWQLDWRPLLEDLLRDRRRNVPPPVCSTRFHRALARGIRDACRRNPHLPVVLTGGVFQNELLTELVLDELQADKREVGAPCTIPPNDGGLAAGQLAVAALTRG